MTVVDTADSPMGERGDSPTGEPTVQPYAAAYLAAHPDRVFAAYEFIVWIGGQWREWAAESGAPYGDRPMTDDERAAFGAWLAARWGSATTPAPPAPPVTAAVSPGSCGGWEGPDA